MNEKIKELLLEYEQQLAIKRAKVKEIIKDSQALVDSDGYPTDLALDAIKNWPNDDEQGWFEFINSLWALKSWGWTVEEEPHAYKENTMVHRYNISTAGWSGNESIIRAMQENYMLWNFCWVQSRRGGHYIFELPTKNEEKE